MNGLLGHRLDIKSHAGGGDSIAQARAGRNINHLTLLPICVLNRRRVVNLTDFCAFAAHLDLTE
jgi:hypothetical protein